jgi:hypothetical protein
VQHDDAFVLSRPLAAILAGPLSSLLGAQAQRRAGAVPLQPGQPAASSCAPQAQAAALAAQAAHAALRRGLQLGAGFWQPGGGLEAGALSQLCHLVPHALLEALLAPGGEQGAGPPPGRQQLAEEASLALQSLAALLGECLAQQREQQHAGGGLHPERLSALGSAGTAACLWALLSRAEDEAAGPPGLLAVAAECLGLMLMLRLPAGLAPQEAGAAAGLAGTLCRLLGQQVPPGQEQGREREQEQAAARAAPQQPTALATAACLQHLAEQLPKEQRLGILRRPGLLPAARSMLAQPGMAAAGLQLLQALASSEPEAQALAAGQPGLLQGLVGLLPLGPAAGDEARQTRVAALQVLRMLVQGSAAAQLAVARLPGAAAALVALLGGEEGEVANEAAETLAALQHDSEEARALLREAGRGVGLGLLEGEGG